MKLAAFIIVYKQIAHALSAFTNRIASNYISASIVCCLSARKSVSHT